MKLPEKEAQIMQECLHRLHKLKYSDIPDSIKAEIQDVRQLLYFSFVDNGEFEKAFKQRPKMEPTIIREDSKRIYTEVRPTPEPRIYRNIYFEYMMKGVIILGIGLIGFFVLFGPIKCNAQSDIMRGGTIGVENHIPPDKLHPNIKRESYSIVGGPSFEWGYSLTGLDTVPCTMLITRCDECVSQSQKGFVVREVYAHIDPTFNQSEPFIHKNLVYLDDKKKPLKGVRVWIAKVD